MVCRQAQLIHHLSERYSIVFVKEFKHRNVCKKTGITRHRSFLTDELGVQERRHYKLSFVRVADDYRLDSPIGWQSLMLNVEAPVDTAQVATWGRLRSTFQRRDQPFWLRSEQGGLALALRRFNRRGGSLGGHPYRRRLRSTLTLARGKSPVASKSNSFLVSRILVHGNFYSAK